MTQRVLEQLLHYLHKFFLNLSPSPMLCTLLATGESFRHTEHFFQPHGEHKTLLAERGKRHNGPKHFHMERLFADSKTPHICFARTQNTLVIGRDTKKLVFEANCHCHDSFCFYCRSHFKYTDKTIRVMKQANSANSDNFIIPEHQTLQSQAVCIIF